MSRKKYLLRLFLFLPLWPMVAAASPPAGEDLEQAVAHLLECVANSGCTFIRNGETHTAEEAAGHMQAKYEHFRKKIRAPEDFIRLAATKSLISGRPYRVVTLDGREMNTADWLAGILKEYRERSQP